MTVTNTSTLVSVRDFIRKLRKTSKPDRSSSFSKATRRSTTPSSAQIDDDSGLVSAVENAQAELTTLLNSLKSPQGTVPNKRQMLDASFNLIRALRGPLENAIDLTLSNSDHGILRIVMKYRIFHLLPDDCQTLQKKTGLAAVSIERILKFLSAHYLVKEDERGVWSITNEAWPYTHESIGLFLDFLELDFGHLAIQLLPFLEKNPKELGTSESPLKFSDGKNLWEQCAENPELGLKVATVMEVYANVDECVPLVAQWLKDETPGTGKFLDVGGGSGHVSAAVAKLTPPGIIFEVQDNDPVSFNTRYPSVVPEIKKRISLRIHDFFKPQTDFYKTEPVDAIFLRRVLHDWSDEDSVQILRNLIPIMEADPKRGTALLINETVLPEKGSAYKHEERLARRQDAIQWAFLNAKERSLREWKNLLDAVDPRLQIDKVLYEDPSLGLSHMAVIVIRLKRN